MIRPGDASKSSTYWTLVKPSLPFKECGGVGKKGKKGRRGGEEGQSTSTGTDEHTAHMGAVKVTIRTQKNIHHARPAGGSHRDIKIQGRSNGTPLVAPDQIDLRAYRRRLHYCAVQSLSKKTDEGQGFIGREYIIL